MDPMEWAREVAAVADDMDANRITWGVFGERMERLVDAGEAVKLARAFLSAVEREKKMREALAEVRQMLEAGSCEEDALDALDAALSSSQQEKE